MKVYRVDKLAKPNGMVLKKKHILAPSDGQALAEAKNSIDCPICEVVSEDGRTVGKVL